MDNRLILIIGGARSGKSSFALEMARAHGGRVTFIATAVATDGEMAARIAAHRAARPSHWCVVEEPLDLAGAISSCRGEAEVVLVDCLTVYLGNLLCAHCGPVGEDENPDPPPGLADLVEAETARLLQAARNIPSLVIMVANEVGQGLVPSYRLGRVFRDLAGRMNQRLAGAADCVYLVQCGLATELKAAAIPPGQAVRGLYEPDQGGPCAPEPGVKIPGYTRKDF